MAIHLFEFKVRWVDDDDDDYDDDNDDDDNNDDDANDDRNILLFQAQQRFPQPAGMQHLQQQMSGLKVEPNPPGFTSLANSSISFLDWKIKTTTNWKS